MCYLELGEILEDRPTEKMRTDLPPYGEWFF